MAPGRDEDEEGEAEAQRNWRKLLRLADTKVHFVAQTRRFPPESRGNSALFHLTAAKTMMMTTTTMVMVMTVMAMIRIMMAIMATPTMRVK